MKRRREKIISASKKYVQPDGKVKIPDHVYYGLSFSKQAVFNLDWLCTEEPDLRIVVSSTWRLNRTLQEIKQVMIYGGFKHADRVIGKTVRMFETTGPAVAGDIAPTREVDRGLEIQEWLTSHEKEWTSFAILDDDSDMFHLKQFLLQTETTDGLQISQCLKLRMMLSNFDMQSYLLALESKKQMEAFRELRKSK